MLAIHEQRAMQRSSALSDMLEALNTLTMTTAKVHFLFLFFAKVNFLFQLFNYFAHIFDAKFALVDWAPRQLGPSFSTFWGLSVNFSFFDLASPPFSNTFVYYFFELAWTLFMPAALQRIIIYRVNKFFQTVTSFILSHYMNLLLIGVESCSQPARQKVLELDFYF